MESKKDSLEVLIVEDDPDLRRILKLQLQSLGMTVHAASDGEEGFEMAKSVQPNIIMLDLMMPKMDGFQVLKRIKSISALEDIPVVILTASHDDRHRRKGLSHFADAYMTKPYTMNEIKSTIAKLIPQQDLAPSQPETTR